MVAEGHRLRSLQVGKAGHYCSGVGLCPLNQCRLDCAQSGVSSVDCVADPEPEIGRYLIITRTRRMQPSGGIRPGDFGQARLYIHVDIFQRGLELEAALRNFLTDGGQPGEDRVAVGV